MIYSGKLLLTGLLSFLLMPRDGALQMSLNACLLCAGCAFAAFFVLARANFDSRLKDVIFIFVTRIWNNIYFEENIA